MAWNNWILVGIGVWMLISPWLLGFSDLNLVTWNNIFMGSLAVVFALWNFAPPEE